MKRTASWFAMDEGYYTKWCPVEGKRTEHERGTCLSCWNNRYSSSRDLTNNNKPVTLFILGDDPQLNCQPTR